MANGEIERRVWLTFSDQATVERPLIWRMSRAFSDVVFDIRQASVQAHIGIMAVLLKGDPERVAEAIAFLREEGVQVDPIEKTVIEG
ncbi:MAG: NIL domain-containing protein [Planctomycetota bacterium]